MSLGPRSWAQLGDTSTCSVGASIYLMRVLIIAAFKSTNNLTIERLSVVSS
jgi:hypothetical protein